MDEDEEHELKSIVDVDVESERDEVDGLLGVRHKKKFRITSSLSHERVRSMRSLSVPMTQSSCCMKYHLQHPCLHYLARIGDKRKLEIVLQVSNKIMTEKIITSCDQKGRTALHYAAAFRGSDADATDCINLILTALKERWTNRNINTQDQERLLFQFVNTTDNCSHETALYLAVKVRHMNASNSLLENMADWDVRNYRGKSPVMKIYKKLPELVEGLLKDRTEEFVQYTDLERTVVSIDFGILIGHPSEAEIKAKDASIYEEMSFISNVCYTPIHLRAKILNHVLVKVFIWLKWNHMLNYFWMARIFQIAWFMLNFIFLLTVYRRDCAYPSNIQYNFTWFNFSPKQRNEPWDISKECEISLLGTVFSWIVLGTATCDGLIFELLPMRVRYRRYWYPMKKKTIRKYFERLMTLEKIVHPIKWIFLATIFISVAPVMKHQGQPFTETQYVIASFGIFLTWHQILLQIGKVTWLQIFVKILLKVLINISLVLLLYASLILAFAGVFCILLPGVGAFSSYYEAMFKMSTFFIGEVDYEDTFYTDQSSDISVSFGFAIFFYGAAIIILHVALLNFLIGLTITNIQDISKYADVYANYACVWQIFLMETFLAQPFPCFNIFRRIRLKLLKRLMLIDYHEYRKLNYNERCFIREIRIDDLPKSMRLQIRELNLPVMGCGQINQ